MARRSGSGLSRRALLQGSGAAVAAAALPAGLRAAPEGASGSDRLWYARPAREWTEALPVGNGRIGAMAFGGISGERLQLNEDTLWTGGPYDPVNPSARAALPEVRRLVFAGRYAEAQALADKSLMARPLSQMTYQSFGELLIDMPDIPDFWARGYRRELDLDSAVATTVFTVGGATFRREVIACPVHQVIAVRIGADKPGRINCGIALRSPQPASLALETDTLIVTGTNRGEHGIAGALRFAGRVRLLHEGGALEPRAGGIGVRDADAVTILIALATSYHRYDDVSGDPAATTQAQIEAAARLGFAGIAAAATAEHRRLYRAVKLGLGTSPAATLPTDARIDAPGVADDPALAALYFNYGRYLLIGASRPGSQPANLQGIWNDSGQPPWGSKYTININTEMNYWPAEPTGLAECTAPLIALVRDLAETGTRTAREMYGARGWVAHHNTDLWRATAPIDGAQWGMWPMGGAWLCTHLWARYEYGRDLAYLRSVYPLMRGAALFFLDTLQADPDTGHLVTNPSLSPENTHPGGAVICAGPTMDMQLLRDLFAQTAQAAKTLGSDAEFARELLAARAKLAPNRIGAQGQLQEWQADWDARAPEQNHRHVSHLYGLYPSHQIDPDETPALAAAARHSLELRGDDTGGWGTAWRANLWARLRDGDRAHRQLMLLLGAGRTYSDLLNANPFQIDGNFGGAAAIAEMLMQSRGDEILLLPALPGAWPAGSVRGLRARGACTVDIEWRGGRLVQATLASAIGGRRIVRHGDRRVTVTLKPGRPLRLTGPALISAK
jgi:alpha-L-fucosidase 2